MGVPKGLALQQKLFNKRYVVPKRPKRWTRDPEIAKKHKTKVRKKRKKPKAHVVKTYKRGGSSTVGGSLVHGSTFIGGSFGTDSSRIFRGNQGTYYSTRIKPSKRRMADFRGRLHYKAGQLVG